jgi:hypothetical protein
MPLLNGIEHIYWTLDLEGEVRSIWDVWISGLKKCESNGFSEVRWANRSFRSGLKNLDFSLGGCPWPNLPPQKKFVGNVQCPPSTYYVMKYIVKLSNTVENKISFCPKVVDI